MKKKLKAKLFFALFGDLDSRLISLKAIEKVIDTEKPKPKFKEGGK